MKIALLFAFLLIWTLGMSLSSILVSNELNATGLGVIFFRLSGNCRKCPKMLWSWSAVEVVAG